MNQQACDARTRHCLLTRAPTLMPSIFSFHLLLLAESMVVAKHDPEWCHRFLEKREERRDHHFKREQLVVLKDDRHCELDNREAEREDNRAGLLDNLASLVVQILELVELAPEFAQDSSVGPKQENALDQELYLVAVDDLLGLVLDKLGHQQ